VTFFLCAGCGDLLEVEDHHVETIHVLERFLHHAIVVHCFNCALENVR
jgi:hypothetical protein